MANKANAAIFQASGPRKLAPEDAAETEAEDDEDSAVHFSSLARSLALCHRSSGTFARHFFTAKSSAGGVIGLMVLIGSGSFSRMADATLNWLLPSKAR